MFEPEELIRRLRPLIGKKADEIWNSYLVSDEEERKLIQHSLENLHSQLVDDYKKEKIILPPPSKFEQLHGDYPAGMVYYADQPLYPFAFLEKELQQHIGVFGRTGSGKSYFVKGLLLTHFFLKKSAVILDWKGTYSELVSPDVFLFEPGSESYPFYFNPLEIEDIPKEHRNTYLRQVIELFIDCYLEDLKLLTVQGVELLLLKSVEDLLSKNQELNFQNIHEWMERFEGRMREMDWKASALNLLYKLNKSPLGNVMNNKSCNIEWLVKQKLIFELNNVGNSKDKSFFIRALLLKLYYHFREQGPSSTMKLFIVIEEAHNILLKRGTGYETIIELLLRQIREFGVGICVIDQHPSLMSLPALGTYCTVAFNLRLEQDRKAMASALNLERIEYLGKLPTRFAIVKIQDRYLEPFLIQAFPIGKNITLNPYKLTPSTIDEEEALVQEINKLYEKPAKKIERRTARKNPSQKSGNHDEAVQRIVRRLEEQQAIPPLHPGQIKLGSERSRLYGMMRQGSRVPGDEEKKQEIIPMYVETGSPRDAESSGETTANPVIPPATKEAQNASQEVIRDISDGKTLISPAVSPDDKSKQVIRDIGGKSEVIRDIWAENKAIRVIRKVTKKEELSWEEIFLAHICLYPIMGAVERYKHLGLNEYQGNRRKDSLLGKNLVLLESIPTSSGRLKIMAPTEQGFQYLRELMHYSDKLGSAKHQYWKKRLQAVFKGKGYSARTEVSIAGKQAVDLVVSGKKSNVAVEIETGINPYGKIIGNVRKCLEHGFCGIVSLILDKDKAGRVRERLAQENLAGKNAAIVTEESLCIESVLRFLKAKKGDRGDVD